MLQYCLISGCIISTYTSISSGRCNYVLLPLCCTVWACLCAHTPTCMWRPMCECVCCDPRLTSDSFFNCTPLYTLRQGLFKEPVAPFRLSWAPTLLQGCLTPTCWDSKLSKSSCLLNKQLNLLPTLMYLWYMSCLWAAQLCAVGASAWLLCDVNEDRASGGSWKHLSFTSYPVQLISCCKLAIQNKQTNKQTTNRKLANSSNGKVGNTEVVLMTSPKGEMTRGIVSSCPVLHNQCSQHSRGFEFGVGRQKFQVQVVFPFCTHLQGQLASLLDHRWSSSWFLEHIFHGDLRTYGRNGAHKAALLYLGRNVGFHGRWTIATW